jgi:UDP-glucuronate 4-epimerase
VSLKQGRLQNLQQQRNFRFVRMGLADKAQVAELFANEQFAKVVHVGAQAEVRYLLQAPDSYVQSNVVVTTPATSPMSRTSPKESCGA